MPEYPFDAKIISLKVTMSVLLILMLCILPSQCEDFAWMTFDQRDATEPFEVSRPVTYNIHIQPVNAAAIKKIELEVGPDTDNIGVSKKFSASDIGLYLKAGETKDFRFEVNFQSPEMRQGEFGKWVSDKNDSSTWDKAWYRMIITQIIGSSIVSENYEGHPKLQKTFFEFKKADVTPKQGDSKDNYSYEITVFGSYKDDIHLQVGPSSQGPWTDLGAREYSIPGQQQILKWDNNTLGFDFNVAYYRFVGRKNSTIYDGPFWPVELEFGNASVDPASGTPARKFTYSVELNASRPIDVVLNVLDVGTNEYFAAGRERYENASHWNRLNWTDIRISQKDEAFGPSSYYFGFHYPESEAYFDSSQKRTGLYYAGPNLSIVDIVSQVTPSNGTIYTLFTYTAEVNTSKPACNMELEILPPGSKIWAGQGKQEYRANDGFLVWPNLSFKTSPDVLGMGKYRFVMDDTVLAEFQGPEIDVAVRNESYKKAAGVARFDYLAEVRSTRPIVEMELIYTDDGITWVKTGLTNMYSSNESKWIALAWRNQPWHKTIRVDERKQ